MTCKHPIVFGGRCADCGAPVGGENAAKNAVEPQNGQTAGAKPAPPENGQETPKKTTRKRKA